MKKLTPLFVIFDGPPAHESGRFVEVETADGESASLGGEWAEREDGLWSLGPVYSQGDIDQLTKRCEDTETDCEDYSAAHDEALTERDALAAEVEQLTQERETGAALDSEARAHDEIYVLDLIEQRDMLVVEVKRLRSFMFVFGPKMGTRR